jgi:hypothetical protein
MALSKFCRVPPKRIRSLDLGQRAPYLNPDLLLRFQNGSPLDLRCTWRRVRYGFCPLCICEQATICVRWDWSLAYLIICAVHGVPLQDGCPLCGDPDPLIFSAPDLAPNTCCRCCGADLTGGVDNSGNRLEKTEIQTVEDAYRNALMGVRPYSTLLGKTTDRAFRQFLQDLLQLLSRRLTPTWSKGSLPFSRQDIAQIVAALILNAAPSSDRSVRAKRYTRGLVLWSTLLSIIPQHEGPHLEQASLRWPLALRRRFVSALCYRKRKRWPYHPYCPSKYLQKRIERIEIASVFGLSPRIT